MNKEDIKYLKEYLGKDTGKDIENFPDTPSIYTSKEKTLSRLVGKLITKIFGIRMAYSINLYFKDLNAMKNALIERIKFFPAQKVTKVAIIGVMTDKYIDYFPRYYESIKNYFLPNTPKHFYCFSDQLDFSYFKNKDVTVIPTKHLPMPWTMLLTFHHMYKIIDKLKDYSHIIYIDTDMYFEQKVLEEDFLTTVNPLFGVKHHAYVNKQGEFDVSKISLASIKENDDLSIYWQASFYGGKTKEFIQLIKNIKARIDTDIKNKIVARYVDESHLNKYFIDNKDKVYTLPPSYSYPSLKPIPSPFNKILVHITKR